MIQIDKWLAIPTVSPNVKDHWGKTYKLRCDQRFWIKYLFTLFPDYKPVIPCKITLIRTSPMTMNYDNMVYSLKYVRDAIAEFITKDYRPGRADDNPRLKWEYDQAKGKLGVRIIIQNI